MLTKERILELLGNAPEKLERWEQEIKLIKCIEEYSPTYVCYVLARLGIPRKKTEHHFCTKEEYLKLISLYNNTNFKDKEQFIKVISKLKRSYWSLKVKVTKRPPTKFATISSKEIIDFYMQYIADNKKSMGWQTALAQKYNFHTSTITRMIRDRKLILKDVNAITVEKVNLFKKLVEECYTKKVYTKYSHPYDYILPKMQEVYPTINIKTLRTIALNCNIQIKKEYVKLQLTFADTLIKQIIPSKSIVIQCTELERKYPMHTSGWYREVYYYKGVKNYIERHRERSTKWRNKKEVSKEERLKLFLETIPRDITNKQKKQIIEAYEKVNY